MSMTTIKASCPDCGDVELVPADLKLMVCLNLPAMSYYAFDCDCCEREVRKPADDHVVALLVSGGVQATVWDVPEEAVEIHYGPALTSNDLLDFALALAGDDRLAFLAEF